MEAMEALTAKSLVMAQSPARPVGLAATINGLATPAVTPEAALHTTMSPASSIEEPNASAVAMEALEQVLRAEAAVMEPRSSWHPHLHYVHAGDAGRSAAPPTGNDAPVLETTAHDKNDAEGMTRAKNPRVASEMVSKGHDVGSGTATAAHGDGERPQGIIKEKPRGRAEQHNDDIDTAIPRTALLAAKVAGVGTASKMNEVLATILKGHDVGSGTATAGAGDGGRPQGVFKGESDSAIPRTALLAVKIADIGSSAKNPGATPMTMAKGGDIGSGTATAASIDGDKSLGMVREYPRGQDEKYDVKQPSVEHVEKTRC